MATIFFSQKKVFFGFGYNIFLSKKYFFALATIFFCQKSIFLYWLQKKIGKKVFFGFGYEFFMFFFLVTIIFSEKISLELFFKLFFIFLYYLFYTKNECKFRKKVIKIQKMTLNFEKKR